MRQVSSRFTAVSSRDCALENKAEGLKQQGACPVVWEEREKHLPLLDYAAIATSPKCVSKLYQSLLLVVSQSHGELLIL
jgi:hypothetical protein